MMQKVMRFLVPILKENGIASFFAYSDRVGIFDTLFFSKIKTYEIFWRSCEKYHPELSQLALKTLKIPAFTSQLKINKFSNESFPSKDKAYELYYFLNTNK